MNRYSLCLDIVLSHEGGYSNHPADRGGETNYGITHTVYDEYRKRRLLEPRSVKEIERNEIEDIYRANYWRPCSCDLLPAPLDLITFDAAVNHGVRQAMKFTQRALGVDDDGIVGTQTLKAAHSDADAGQLPEVCESALNNRDHFYHQLAQRQQNQKVFLAGWLNRVSDLRNIVRNQLAQPIDHRGKP